jgi:hypothetical protein
LNANNKTTHRSPLLESLSRLDLRKDKSAAVFYAVLLFIFIFLAFLPFSGSVQRLLMGKFHLTLKPFSGWAVTQLLPAMYNFENKLFWSAEMLNENLLANPAPGVYHLSVNHYPMRMVYFTPHRKAVVFSRPLYIYLQSAYRGRAFVTSYLISSTPQNIHVQFLNAYERLDR